MNINLQKSRTPLFWSLKYKVITLLFNIRKKDLNLSNCYTWVFEYSALGWCHCFGVLWEVCCFFSCSGKSCSQLLQVQQALPGQLPSRQQPQQPRVPPSVSEEPGGRGRQRVPQGVPQSQDVKRPEGQKE